MKTALYTTVHPASFAYLEPFFASVAAQTDREFDFWVGLDLAPEELEPVSGFLENAHVVTAEPGDTPSSLRGRAWAQIVTLYDAVIFVDSDDVLYSGRVAAAKKQLEVSDMGGCALDLIAENGAPLGVTLQAPPEHDWAELLPRCNVFGLSNTACRCEVLAKTLPLPEVAVVDWLVVTRAYLAGARLGFDAAPKMAYRQYRSNTAQVLPPFTPEGILRATAHVLTHLQYVLQEPPSKESFKTSLEQRFAEVQRFSERIRGDVLTTYTRELNARTQPVYLWWACVAHKELAYLWSDGYEST